MRKTFVALFFVLAAAAHAATPEQAYLAARDAAIKTIERSEKQKVAEETVTKLHDAALADLQKRLRSIVGPLDMKGFPADGKINLGSLSKGDEGFGTLDGLVHSADEKTSVVVTTLPLFKVWIKAHRTRWPDLQNVPQNVGAALQSDAFYTQAIDSGAAFSKYAVLPVAKPDGSTAVALLGARAQDIGPRPADLIIVAAVRGNRVFVVSAAARNSVDDFPACRAIWDESVRKVADLHKQFEAGGRKNDKRFSEQIRKTENGGDAAYRACFAERLKADPRFKTATDQAQSLLDALPPK